MKFSLLFVCLLLSALFGVSQVAINTDGSLPNPNAILDLKSGTQGILFPRTDSVSRKAIPNIGGMIIFDTTTNSPWYNTGATWVNLANTGSLGWLTTGNAGTVDGTNFIGTIDNTALDFRVNNQPSGKIDQGSQNTFFGYQSGINSTYSSQNTGYGNTRKADTVNAKNIDAYYHYHYYQLRPVGVCVDYFKPVLPLGWQISDYALDQMEPSLDTIKPNLDAIIRIVKPAHGAIP